VTLEQDIERLWAFYADWAQGRYDRDDMFDQETEFVIAGPEPRSYSGREGVRRGWFDWLSAWDDFRSEAEEILPGAVEGTYLVMVRLHARGKESSVPTEADGANLVSMRDGMITRFEMFWDRDAALVAAGLSPRP
jgi:ketosteroid isomerase-like protein